MVAVVDSPDPVPLGNTITYSVTVTNQGPATGSAVTLEAFLPEGLATLVSAEPDQGTCDVTVTCDLGGLAVGGTARVTIVVSADAPGSVSYPFSVSSAEGDPDIANNNTTPTTTVTDPLSADLSVAVVDSPDPVEDGSHIT